MNPVVIPNAHATVGTGIFRLLSPVNAAYRVVREFLECSHTLRTKTHHCRFFAVERQALPHSLVDPLHGAFTQTPHITSQSLLIYCEDLFRHSHRAVAGTTGFLQNNMGGHCFFLVARRQDNADYREIFLKVHRIAKTIPLPRNERIQTIGEVLEDFDAKSVLEEVQNGKLYPYICTLTEREIAAVQAVFYLGRDYIAPETTEEETAQWIDQLAEEPDAEYPVRPLCVDDPDALLRLWIDEVRYSSPWQGREEEILFICYKEEVFRMNWERGLKILGIIH